MGWQFLVRATPEVHRAVALAALRAGKSMNAWVADTLERAAREREPEREPA